MTLDKESEYIAPTSLTITLPQPLQQAELLITVESGCVVDVEVVQVSNLQEGLLVRARVLDLDNDDNKHLQRDENVQEAEDTVEDIYEFKFNNKGEVCE